jgi:alpha-amylase/alpha-mannosidase (GH57 family)
MAQSPLYLQFVWHFHQPYYGLPEWPAAALPWVRLHAIKSYYDMGRTLWEHPGVRCTINFSGSLLRQIEEYVAEGKRDTWWELTMRPAAQLGDAERRLLMRTFFNLSPRCIEAHARYAELRAKVDAAGDEPAANTLTTAELRDLQVWFNLAWFGAWAREERGIVKHLIEKGRGFTESEKEALMEQQIEVMQLILPMYRDLEARGQIEISATPMYHPILPLVLDTEVSVRATPERPRPARFEAPMDAQIQLRESQRLVRRLLGVDTDGVWPAEGAVSPEVVALLAEEYIDWAASDEGGLEASRGEGWVRDVDLLKPWRLDGHERPALFFRDHALSDKLGFVYAKLGAEEAVADLMGELEAWRARGAGAAAPVLTVILDGENPWEHYEGDGVPFLRALYERLEQTPWVETTTPSAYLGEHGASAGVLERLHTGSWIDANLAIWIGDGDENRAWELLGRARAALVDALDRPDVDEDQLERAWEALFMAEGSDWFWWYGDDFSNDLQVEFDRLFREQLRTVYTQLGLPEPAELSSSLREDGLVEINFTPPRNLIHPRVDGRSDYFYEWSGAGVYRPTGGRGSMFVTSRYVREIYVGFSLHRLYIRIELGPEGRAKADDLQIKLKLVVGERTYDVLLNGSHGGEGSIRGAGIDDEESMDQVAFGENFECGIPRSQLGVRAGEWVALVFGVLEGGVELERHPHDGALVVEVPDPGFDMRNWMV